MRRWEELRDDLDERGVEIVTVCTDTPAEIRKGIPKHGLQATMLSDPQLVVTDLYNLRNPTNLTPGGVKAMPIPTTFLVDARGTVRWMDQTDDYMLRSEPERVLSAIRTQLT